MIVAAMRHVATVGGARPLTDVDRTALTSAWHYLFPRFAASSDGTEGVDYHPIA